MMCETVLHPNVMGKSSHSSFVMPCLICCFTVTSIRSLVYLGAFYARATASYYMNVTMFSQVNGGVLLSAVKEKTDSLTSLCPMIGSL